jgi:hypothetical protein
MTAGKARALRWWHRQAPTLEDAQLAVMFGVTVAEVNDACTCGRDRPLSRVVSVYSLALSIALAAGASEKQRGAARTVMEGMSGQFAYRRRARRQVAVTSFSTLLRAAIAERIEGRD